MTYAQEYYAEHKERMKRQITEARRQRRRLVSKGTAQQRPTALSARERQVLALMVDGLLNKEIAARLFLAEGTVKVFAGRLYVKLRVHNRAEAIALAIRTGIV